MSARGRGRKREGIYPLTLVLSQTNTHTLTHRHSLTRIDMIVACALVGGDGALEGEGERGS